MKFHSAVTVLKLLSTKPEEALTVQQIVKKWNRVHSSKLHVRTAQRYMSELCSDSAESQALVQIDDTQKDWKYYLRLSEVANWFMTEEMALQLVLSNATVEGTKTAKVRIYATNYNVLRIMSGINSCAQQLAAILDICFLVWVNSVKQIYLTQLSQILYNQLVC